MKKAKKFIDWQKINLVASFAVLVSLIVALLCMINLINIRFRPPFWSHCNYKEYRKFFMVTISGKGAMYGLGSRSVFREWIDWRYQHASAVRQGQYSGLRNGSSLTYILEIPDVLCHIWYFFVICIIPLAYCENLSYDIGKYMGGDWQWARN